MVLPAAERGNSAASTRRTGWWPSSARGAPTLIGCTKPPIYDPSGSKKREFCSEHKIDGMKDVVSKRCGHTAGCTKPPTFGVAGSKKREFCSEHKKDKDGMVDVVSKRCTHTGFAKPLIYGPSGSKKREFCSEHKKDGMVDAVSKRCTHTGCTKPPIYGASGSTKKREFCLEHKKDEMVGVASKRCIHAGCTKYPRYGVAGSKKKELCAEHKKDGMVDAVSNRCTHTGCTKYPSYGVAGSVKRELCAEQKKDGMAPAWRRHPSSAPCAAIDIDSSEITHNRGESEKACEKGPSFRPYSGDFSGSTVSPWTTNKRACKTPGKVKVEDPPSLGTRWAVHSLPRGVACLRRRKWRFFHHPMIVRWRTQKPKVCFFAFLRLAAWRRSDRYFCAIHSLVNAHLLVVYLDTVLSLVRCEPPLRIE